MVQGVDDDGALREHLAGLLHRPLPRRARVAVDGTPGVLLTTEVSVLVAPKGRRVSRSRAEQGQTPEGKREICKERATGGKLDWLRLTSVEWLDVGGPNRREGGDWRLYI